MIVLARGELIDILLCGKVEIFFLGATQVMQHRCSVDPFLQAEIDTRVLLRVEKVIALILRVVHPKMFANVGSERMDLEREVAASNGIEEVEANGKLRAEPSSDIEPQQFFRMREHEIDGGNLDTLVAECQQQTVLFRNTIEAPGVIGSAVGGQAAHAFHPVAAPWPRIEEGNNAKRAAHDCPQTAPKSIAIDGLWAMRHVRIQQHIDVVEQASLQPVRRTPVHEEGALVLEGRRLVSISCAKVANLVATLPHLNFPSRE